MSNGTTSQAVERQHHTAAAMVKQYERSFAAVLPSHIAKPETWVRLAQGALKKGKRAADGSGRTELEVAAANNPAVFLSTLLDCARLGLEPGTEQYYLTPRPVKGRLEILGIVGYQGIIELMYRAGAVASVVAECVHAGDEFEWVPGQLDTQHPPRWAGPQVRPFHRVNWMAEDRGPLRLVYAYAEMKGGAVSKVVVLNQTAIDRIKAKSQGADTKYSPWVTTPEAMWLKSAVRQLSKWVPTSAEYIRERLRAQREVDAEALEDLPADLPAVDSDTGERYDGAIDAEILDDDGWDESPFETEGA